ncbi:MAG TPA: EamA family transporter, partial [Arenibaculum sp.]|nr:EamA family transporter [Arenibaculum sp.]
MQTFGIAALALGTLAYCWGSVIAKFNMKARSVVELSGLQNLIGGISLILVGAFVERDALVRTDYLANPTVILAWLHLVVIGSIIGFTLYLHMLKIWGTAKASSYAFITPVIALSIDVIFLRAAMTSEEVAGSLIILLAVSITF